MVQTVAGGQMKIFKDYRQDQSFLLPPSLDEFIPKDHEVHLINDVVNQLDLSSLRQKRDGGGAPAYDPGMMLKVLIYAYSLGIYSSRQILRELKTDTAFMYLSAMQIPDFRTLCLFRSVNSDALSEIFVQVVRICASVGMVRLGHIAIDGTKLKANASGRRNIDKEALEKEIERIKAEVKDMVKTAEEMDEKGEVEFGDRDGSELPQPLEDKEGRLEQLKKAKALLERENLKTVNLSDPDSRLMQNKKHYIEPSYNVQIAVDDKAQIIVAAEVSQKAADYDEFQVLLEHTKRNLGQYPLQVSADSGYFKYENLVYAEQQHIDTYLPDNMIEWLESKTDAEKRYHKSNFKYDAGQDVYYCPEGQVLRPFAQQVRKQPGVFYKSAHCAECPAKARCTPAPYRKLWRTGHEELVSRMREKLRTPEGKRIYQKRMYTVEPIFGDFKLNRRKSLTYLRGLGKVRGEFMLLCLVHNVRKLIRRAS
jgi:transposase